MSTAYISHPDCHKHDTGEGHPENAMRLSAIEDQFVSTGLFDVLRYFDAPEVSEEQLLRVHTPGYLESIQSQAPTSGYARLDPDTVISPDSPQAARRAAGADVVVCRDVDQQTRRNEHGLGRVDSGAVLGVLICSGCFDLSRTPRNTVVLPAPDGPENINSRPGEDICYSTFCTISRIRSMHVFTWTTRFAISASFALEPMVFVSRRIS